MRDCWDRNENHGWHLDPRPVSSRAQGRAQRTTAADVSFLGILDGWWLGFVGAGCCVSRYGEVGRCGGKECWSVSVLAIK